MPCSSVRVSLGAVQCVATLWFKPRQLFILFISGPSSSCSLSSYANEMGGGGKQQDQFGRPTERDEYDLNPRMTEQRRQTLGQITLNATGGEVSFLSPGCPQTQTATA